VNVSEESGALYFSNRIHTMTNDYQWYAVYTKPRWEKKVALLLTERNVSNYCPLNKVERSWKDRRKVVLEPLFKSYVFVHVSSKEKLDVLQTDGVLNFVKWLGQPAVIRKEEIQMIKNFLREYNNVKVENTEIRLEDRVRISNGPLKEHEGNVVGIKGKTVIIYLPSLKISLYAEVDKSNVAKVEKIC
jgi:transcription antitermination factor NusG